MKYDVEFTIIGSGSIQVEADTLAEARKIAMGLDLEVDLSSAPEAVSYSSSDLFANLTDMHRRVGVRLQILIEGISVSEAEPEPRDKKEKA